MRRLIIKRYPKGTTLPGSHLGLVYWASYHQEAAARLKEINSGIDRGEWTAEKYIAAYPLRLDRDWTGKQEDFLVIELEAEENEFGPVCP